VQGAPDVGPRSRGSFARILDRLGLRDAPRSFRIHLGIYLCFVLFWIVIWALTGGGYFWPVWPTIGWGIGVAIHGVVALSGGRGHANRRHDDRSHDDRRHLDRRSQAVGENAKRAEAATHGWHERSARAGGSGIASRRWVTVMFTDISNSTSLTEALGDEEWSRFLARHRELLRDAFSERGGVEVGTQGDGLLARFDSPAHAVLCAIDIQRRIDEVREGGGLVPRIRIGIHAGEAVASEGDIVGRVVNLAARVTSEAAPGEILVTEPVADELAGRIELEDRGLRPLRGVAQPRHLLAVRWS
jgi:class 3 adenylate cyclase